jgi:hypothetical protein
VDADKPERLRKLAFVVGHVIRRIHAILDLVCIEERVQVTVLLQKQASASPVLEGKTADVTQGQTNTLEVSRSHFHPTVTRIVVLDKRSVHRQKSSDDL